MSAAKSAPAVASDGRQPRRKAPRKSKVKCRRRPKCADGEPRVGMCLWVAPRVLAAATAAAEREGLTRSAWFRRLIVAALGGELPDVPAARQLKLPGAE